MSEELLIGLEEKVGGELIAARTSRILKNASMYKNISNSLVRKYSSVNNVSMPIFNKLYPQMELPNNLI
ncbi:hypothetical protein G3A39_44145 [Paraburkholderia aspalathi]|nr:hypothetical protein [Paraburkholderia aspalathi]